MSHLQVKNASIICTRTPSSVMAKEEQSWCLQRTHHQERLLARGWHSDILYPRLRCVVLLSAQRRVGSEARCSFTAGAGCPGSLSS